MTVIVVNGWTLYAHPLFLDQLGRLTQAVGALKRKRPDDHASSANAKLLAAIRHLIFEVIPADPTLARYRQGGTLGGDMKHWFRAKFGNGRFRLFFRYSLQARIIIFAWVNDETTLRTYGSRSDAHSVFKGMLDDSDPPDDWAALLAACRDAGARARFSGLMEE